MNKLLVGIVRLKGRGRNKSFVIMSGRGAGSGMAASPWVTLPIKGSEVV